MAEPTHITLLYKGRISIPDQIIQDALAKTPTGYCLHVCSSDIAEEKRRELLARSSYVIAYSIPVTDYEQLGGIKLLQLLSAGFDTIDIPQFKRLKIPVANNGSANASTVAEHAVLLMLSVMKRLPVHHQALQQGEWLGHHLALELSDIRGKQVGILGFGAIGREVARKLSGFNAKTVYYDPYPACPEVEQELNVQRLDFDELIATSDVISVHMPLSEVTRGLLGDKAFSAMKNSAIVINTSRGPVVDEQALIRALEQGEIGGAGLDVYSSEPLLAGSGLCGRNNVVMTPHIAGTSVDNWQRRLEFAFENIQRVADGIEPLARVDR